MTPDNFSNLLKYSDKCARLQTRNPGKAGKYFSLIDAEIGKLKANGCAFNLEVNNEIYKCPVDVYALEYFRPLFKMSTHRKIREARADDTHAVDFDIPLKTPVCAVSPGIVAAIQSDSTAGGNDSAFSGKDNYLYTLDESGRLMFCYRHLEAFDHIRLNDRIEKGAYLGCIGLTGYVVTPHLHFAVYEINKSKEYILKSIPVKFFSK